MSNPNVELQFNEIYESTSKTVLAYIIAKCKYTADINDIFQDTYLELYQVLNSHTQSYVQHPKAFTLKIARRKISRYYTLLERIKRFVSMTTVDDYRNEIDLSDFNTDAVMIEDFIIDCVILESAKKYLNSKSEEIQKVFFLYYDFGLTILEIAQTLNISQSNVKHKLYRTLNELREILMKGDEFDERE